MKYLDTETGEILDESQLFDEYCANAEEIQESSGAKTFSQWLENCTRKNGFLEIVK